MKKATFKIISCWHSKGMCRLQGLHASFCTKATAVLGYDFTKFFSHDISNPPNHHFSDVIVDMCEANRVLNFLLHLDFVLWVPGFGTHFSDSVTSLMPRWPRRICDRTEAVDASGMVKTTGICSVDAINCS